MRITLVPPSIPALGFVGLGKLGLPCAAALSATLQVPIRGYDKNSAVKTYVETATVPYVEEGAEDCLARASLTVEDSVEDVVAASDIVFVAVQTPHDPEYEGITPAPTTRKDFDYTYLENAVSEIVAAYKAVNKQQLHIVVISTVLPGTVRSRLLPLLADTDIALVYNPYFIAMGTTIHDFLNPEFVILGSDDSADSAYVADIYRLFLDVPKFYLTYEEAELVKVSYNTFIGMKIVFANTLAEITEAIGGNVDKVTRVLGQATNRLISTKYLSAGMGDGGGCHPRDQIAMSWLADELELSFDIFSALAEARDSHTRAHAEILKDLHEHHGLPVVILGEAYKKDINLTVGSPSKLLQHYLKELNVSYTVFDPVVYPEQFGDFQGSHIFYVATPHSVFKNYALPLESVVVDPWGDSIQRQYSIKYKYLGRGAWG